MQQSHCNCEETWINIFDNIFSVSSKGSVKRINGGERNRKLIVFKTPRGSTLGLGHLVESDIVKIRQLRSTGISGAKLAKQFNVTPSTISKITLFQSWTHVK
jgi:hypothetical protein